MSAPAGTVELLIEFYREKLAQLLQHQTHARHVSQYDANNTYQYIVNREDVQLTWLARAISTLIAVFPRKGSWPVARR